MPTCDVICTRRRSYSYANSKESVATICTLRFLPLWKSLLLSFPYELTSSLPTVWRKMAVRTSVEILKSGSQNCVFHCTTDSSQLGYRTSLLATLIRGALSLWFEWYQHTNASLWGHFAPFCACLFGDICTPVQHSFTASYTTRQLVFGAFSLPASWLGLSLSCPGGPAKLLSDKNWKTILLHTCSSFCCQKDVRSTIKYPMQHHGKL